MREFRYKTSCFGRVRNWVWNDMEFNSTHAYHTIYRYKNVIVSIYKDKGQCILLLMAGFVLTWLFFFLVWCRSVTNEKHVQWLQLDVLLKPRERLQIKFCNCDAVCGNYNLSIWISISVLKIIIVLAQFKWFLHNSIGVASFVIKNSTSSQCTWCC